MQVNFSFDPSIWALPLVIAYDDEYNAVLAIGVLCFSVEIYF